MNRLKRVMRDGDDRAQDAAAKACKVLILEDDVFWAEIISRNIELALPQAEVLWASSALEAAVRLDQDRGIDLVVADQCLGSLITGLDVWRALQNAGRGIPFILTSGSTEAKAFEPAGVAPDSISEQRQRMQTHQKLQKPWFIAKPFSNSDFQSAVHWMVKVSNRTRAAKATSYGSR